MVAAKRRGPAPVRLGVIMADVIAGKPGDGGGASSAPGNGGGTAGRGDTAVRSPATSQAVTRSKTEMAF
jgi:hypothetical protein